MAALCQGPVSFKEKRVRSDAEEVAFSKVSLFSWINSLFANTDSRFHAAARSALEALLLYNPKEPSLMDIVINEWYATRGGGGRDKARSRLQIRARPQCYSSGRPDAPALILSRPCRGKTCAIGSYVGAPDSPATRGYFMALVDVFTRAASHPCHLPTMLTLVLFKTADPSQPIRKAGKMPCCEAPLAP